MTPAELTSAIRALLDETERLAHAAGYHHWALGVVYGTVIATGNGKTVARDCREYDAEHIALHNPAAVLRRVAADREILAEHSPYALATSWYCSACGDVPQVMFPCATFRALARGLGIDLEENTDDV